jgi:hypothetical protein
MRNPQTEIVSKKLCAGNVPDTMADSTSDTKWNRTPTQKIPSAGRKTVALCFRMERMAWKRPTE